VLCCFPVASPAAFLPLPSWFDLRRVVTNERATMRSVRSVRSVGSAGRARCVRASALDVFVIDATCVTKRSKDGSVRVNDHVARALRRTTSPYYVLSDTDEETCSRTLQEEAGVHVPTDAKRIYTCETPRKKHVKQILERIDERPLLARDDVRAHYISTERAGLQAAAESSQLEAWKLYWATWSEERETKATDDLHPRIRKLQEQQVEELVEWGLLQGVHDGCEPTEEEVRRGVHPNQRE